MYSLRGGASGIDVDEDEPGPHVAVHRHQPEVDLVEVEELTFLLHERAGAVESVAPPVVLAGELARGAAGLVLREVRPDELVATVPADVVERADLAVLVADHHDRRLRDRQLLREVAPAPR